MKRFFLIPLMTLCTCVMAWATDAHVSTIADLNAKLADASVETIYLDADLTYAGEACINILRSVTIDGQGHTLSGQGIRTGSTYSSLAINQGAPSNSNWIDSVALKNLTIRNTRSAGQALNVRCNLSALLIDKCEIITTNAGGNSQPITFGGNQSTPVRCYVYDSKVTANTSGYPVITFNPIALTTRNTTYTGYCGLYFKEPSSSAGSRGSVVNADACNFECPNVHSGVSNAFSCFPLCDDGITINLHNCGMNIEQIGDQNQALVTTNNNNTARREQPINITISGDNSHFNTKGGSNKTIQNLYLQGSYKYQPYGEINVTISGGTYSVNPELIRYYDQWIPVEEGNPTSVTVKYVTIPAEYEVKEITMEGVATPLYRVVKKAQDKADGTLYDLNDLVKVEVAPGDSVAEGVAAGNNPISSFDLSTGTDMTLNNEVTTAGYVQISDNATEGATTVIVNKTASDKEQTLVINNGLDVQGDSKVEVKPGASLIIGEGGINTEKPENIVLEVTEDAGAAILLDPTITVNQNPNLTVKLTTNSKQLTASPWTYVYQRFAIPVKVGIVPANDFDGELFPGNTSFKNYVFEWNGYDWVTCSSWGALEPFKGYQLANNSKEGGVTYTFTGQLVGNDNSVYNFPTGGFDFFGNSHLAPIYIDSLLKPYEDQAVEASVWLYNYESKNFEAITSEDIADGWAFATEIKPMEGFILNYHGASGSAGMNYASAIWGNPKFDAAIGRPSQSNPAPARNRVSETSNRAIINVVAENGQGDNVKLVEKEKYSAEFENGADASKFVYDNAVSIYASTENGELSRVATNDLTGTLLSFNSNDATNYTITLSNVLGEDYALRDNVTGQTIAFAEGATYTFTQAANTTVPARFEVVSAAKLPTAIDNVEEAAKVSGIYTITGQYLGRDFTNLPAGVYIVNGVKIVK